MSGTEMVVVIVAMALTYEIIKMGFRYETRRLAARHAVPTENEERLAKLEERIAALESLLLEHEKRRADEEKWRALDK